MFCVNIVNTIGTIDDLIENFDKQVASLLKLGGLLFSSFENYIHITNLCDISLGGTPSRKHPEYWNGSIKWINSGAITGNPSIREITEYITNEGIIHSATKKADSKDTVISIIEPSPNKVSLVLDDNVFFNQSVICFHSKNTLYRGHIFFGVKCLINELKNYATGAAQQSINKELVESSYMKTTNNLTQVTKLNEIVNRIFDLETKRRNLNNIKKLLLSKYF